MFFIFSNVFIYAPKYCYLYQYHIIQRNPELHCNKLDEALKVDVELPQNASQYNVCGKLVLERADVDLPQTASQYNACGKLVLERADVEGNCDKLGQRLLSSPIGTLAQKQLDLTSN